jgi:rSAM/selenodomain-associated transferase 1
VLEAMRVLGLFAKQPVPGQVKTRLASESSPAWACQVAEALLGDCLDRFAKVNAQRFVAMGSDSAEAYFEAAAGGRYQLISQGQGDLGERMARFIKHHLSLGAGEVVIVGTDSPTVPVSYVEQAFAELEHRQVVIGPATDGGYYLLGCARQLPPIFDGITWSSPSVLAQTMDRLQSAACQPALLPPWYDVDTLADWQMLAGHVAALRLAGVDPGVPRTEKLLQERSLQWPK